MKKSKDEVTTTALTEPASQYQIMTLPEGGIQKVLMENLGTIEITAEDLEKVKVPSGGGTAWTIPTAEGEVHNKYIDGIIVATQIVRAFWKEEYGKGEAGAPPDCSSDDGIQGFGDPGGSCSVCPMNKYETAKEGSGRGKACQEGRLIFIVMENEILPIRIKAPSMSLKPSRQYLIRLTSARKPVYSVYTRIGLIADKNKDQQDYSKMTFEKIGDVENLEPVKKYADAISASLKKIATEMKTERDYSDNEV